jgi:hypothetical protein
VLAGPWCTQNLADLGEWPDLRAYALALQQQAQDFDLDRLPQSLREFPELLAKLEPARPPTA